MLQCYPGTVSIANVGLRHHSLKENIRAMLEKLAYQKPEYNAVKFIAYDKDSLSFMNLNLYDHMSPRRAVEGAVFSFNNIEKGTLFLK